MYRYILYIYLCYHQNHYWVHLVFYWGFMLLNFCVVFCGPLFIFLSLFCWSLYCLYFNLPLLINPIDIFINCSYMLSFFVISTNSLKTHIASCEICNKYWKWDIVLHKKYPTQTWRIFFLAGDKSKFIGNISFNRS